MFYRFLHIVILTLFFALVASTAYAGWAVNGDAYWVDLPGDSEQVTLTDEVQNQAGSAWIETQIDLASDFDISFRMHLGTRDSNGADGISFAFHRDPAGTTAFGDTSGGGEWIGMNGICPSVSIEVDTWQNGNRGDPSYDHLGVNEYTPSGANCSGTPNHSGAGPVQAVPGVANIEDGNEHVLRVTWDSTNYIMDIYFDDMSNRRLRYTNDIVTNIFSGQSMVYFGFAASTGGSYNEQYIIPNTPTVSAGKVVDDSVILKSELPQNVEYEITIDNDGDVTGFGTQITDTLPAGFTYVNNSTTGATTVNPSISYSGGRQVLQWDMSATPIPPNGGSMTIYFDVTVTTSVTPGSFPNDFTVSGDNFSPINQTEMAEVVIGPADLTVTKAHTGNFSVGQNGTFTFDVSNNGPDYAEDIVIEDTLPAGLDYVGISGSGWSLLSNSGQTYRWTHAGPVNNGASLPTLTVTVFANDTTGAAYPSVTNTATVSSSSPDLVPGNDSDSDSVTVNPLADLSIAKSHSGDFGVGSNGIYNLVVTNNGPNEDTAASITVADTLPAGLNYVSHSGAGWSLASSSGQTYTFTHAGPLASGASLDTLALTVLPGASAVGTVTNSATVSSPTNDDVLTNNSTTDATTVLPSVDLAVSKTNTGGPFALGANAVFDIVVSNNGPNNETGIITLEDTLPSGLTYVSHSGTGWSLASTAGQVYTFTHTGPLNVGTSLPTLSITASVGIAAYPTATNSATVSTAAHDPDGANNTDTATISVVPEADLSIAKSHTGDFGVGSNGVYYIDVSNAGPTADPGPVTVSDTLPVGLNYVSVAGTGWSLDSSSGQTYNFVHAGPVPSGGSLPTLEITVLPAAGSGGIVTNSATVSSPTTDGTPGNDSASDPTTILDTVDLSIQKTDSGPFMVSSNGTYSIVVTNNSGNPESGSIYVEDTMPAGLNYVDFSGTGWNLHSTAGTTYTWVHAGPLAGGATLDTLTISVFTQPAAYPSVTNTASVYGDSTDSNAANNSDSVTTTVNRPSGGNKPLYMYGSGNEILNRAVPTSSLSAVTLVGYGDTETWTLDPALSESLTVAAGSSHTVHLQVGWNSNHWRYLRVNLSLGGTSLGNQDTGWWRPSSYTDPAEFQFSFTNGSDITLSPGDTITVQVNGWVYQNNSGQIHIYPRTGTSPNYEYSYVDFSSATVIAIENLDPYDTAYSGGSVTTSYDISNPVTVYIRAEISDPFGSYDITGANIDLIDSTSTTQVSGAAMTMVNDSGGSTKTFEYAYTLNNTMATGLWTARVTAIEGTEGLVTDVATTHFSVTYPPDFTVLKTSTTLSDPYNGTVNPKAIPGAVVMYSVLVTNFGGSADVDSFFMTDPINANTELFVDDFDGSGPLSGPVQFNCSSGTPPCGLTYTYSSLGSFIDDVDFSRFASGNDFTYIPVPDGDGFDDLVRRLRVSPKGEFSRAGASNPNCTIYFKVRVK